MIRCICEIGYTGSRCEMEINPCDSNPCQGNFSQCQSLSSFKYECQCNPPLTGQHCQVEYTRDYIELDSYSGKLWWRNKEHWLQCLTESSSLEIEKNSMIASGHLSGICLNSFGSELGD